MEAQNKSDNSLIGKWPDPISFLEDYKEFAVNIRLATVEAVVEQYYREGNEDNRYLLFFGGIEQFFFALEMLLAFFHASVDKTPLDLAKWIYPQPVDGKKYYNLSFMQNEVEKIKCDDIRRIYRNEFSELAEPEIEALIHPLDKILGYLQATQHKKAMLGEHATREMITIFHRCRHKFLAYRYKGFVSLLVPKDTELWLEEMSQKTQNKKELTENPPGDISWLVNHVRTPVDYTKIVIDKIIKRLRQPGANKWISGPGKHEKTITLP